MCPEDNYTANTAAVRNKEPPAQLQSKALKNARDAAGELVHFIVRMKQKHKTRHQLYVQVFKTLTKSGVHNT